jgi:DNA-binding response OmpR family regulator
LQILVIEDNSDIIANIYEYFEPLGHSLDCARDGVSGLSLAAEDNYDVIILDVMLPRLDGIKVCQKLRDELKLSTPVLMLTARDTIEDKVTGFDSGADDYLVKPFSLIELESRLKALVRRASDSHVESKLTLGSLEFDPLTLSLIREGVSLKLKPIGYKLLGILLKDSPQVFSRKKLESLLWGDLPPDSDALRTHIHSLRQEIDKPFKKSMVKTVQGMGYCMVNPDE